MRTIWWLPSTVLGSFIMFTRTLQYWSVIGFSVCVLVYFSGANIEHVYPSGEDQHGFRNCVARGVWGECQNLFLQNWICSHLVCDRSLVTARRCTASWNTISSVRWQKALGILAFFDIVWFLRLTEIYPLPGVAGHAHASTPSGLKSL